MKNAFYILLSVLISVFIGSCGVASETLIVYQYPNDKYGYVDESGKEIIEGKFDYAAPFSEGRALVAMGNRFGYIDGKGEIVIPLEYILADNFYDGRARVNKNNLFGYIDTDGKEIIPCLYDNLGRDSEQEILYGVLSGKCGIIDLKGNTVLPFEYDDMNLSEYPGVILIIKSGLKGFASKSGEILLNPEYSDIDRFANDHYLVCKESGRGILDSQYNTVIPCEFNRINYMKIKGDGFLFKVSQNDLYGIFNSSGSALTPIKYSSIGDFDERGISQVEVDRKHGRINEAGKEILAPIYNRILRENDNLYLISQDYKEGAADSTGHIFIECKYKSIKPIDNGYFVAYVDDGDIVSTCGMFNSNGELIYDFIYRAIASDEYFIYPYLRKEGLWGLADKVTAKFVIPCKFSSISGFVFDGGKYAKTMIAHPKHTNCYKAEGLLDTTGREILPCNYYFVQRVENDVALVRDCDNVGFYNVKLQK